MGPRIPNYKLPRVRRPFTYKLIYRKQCQCSPQELILLLVTYSFRCRKSNLNISFSEDGRAIRLSGNLTLFGLPQTSYWAHEDDDESNNTTCLVEVGRVLDGAFDRIVHLPCPVNIAGVHILRIVAPKDPDSCAFELHIS